MASSSCSSAPALLDGGVIRRASGTGLRCGNGVAHAMLLVMLERALRQTARHAHGSRLWSFMRAVVSEGAFCIMLAQPLPPQTA